MLLCMLPKEEKGSASNRLDVICKWSLNGHIQTSSITIVACLLRATLNFLAEFT